MYFSLPHLPRKSILWPSLAFLLCASLLTAAELFPAPEENDCSFVTQQGSPGSKDLNRSHYNNNPPIEIELHIPRWYGTREQIRKQIENGLLPRTVTLQMPAFDVDRNPSNSNYPPEIDEVFLNGEKIGILNGANNVWALNTFTVETEKLRFPEAPGEVGINNIRIQVDVQNTQACWCTSIQWVQIEIPAARPVIFLPGYKGENANFHELHRQFERDFGLPNIILADRGDNGIYQNAALLKEDIESLKKLWCVDEFNIIAHSKGGLDARCYANQAHHELDGQDVRYILQIATPNCGATNCDAIYNGTASAIIRLGTRFQDEHFSNFTPAHHDLQVCIVNQSLNHGKGGINRVRGKKAADYTLPRAPLSTSNAEIHQIALSATSFDSYTMATAARLVYSHSWARGRWGDGIVQAWSAMFCGDAYEQRIRELGGSVEQPAVFYNALCPDSATDAACRQNMLRFLYANKSNVVEGISPMEIDSSSHTHCISDNTKASQEILQAYRPYLAEWKSRENSVDAYRKGLRPAQEGPKTPLRATLAASAPGSAKGTPAKDEVQAVASQNVFADIPGADTENRHSFLLFARQEKLQFLFHNASPQWKVRIQAPDGTQYIYPGSTEFTFQPEIGFSLPMLVCALPDAPAGKYEVLLDGRSPADESERRMYMLQIQESDGGQLVLHCGLEKQRICHGEPFLLHAYSTLHGEPASPSRCAVAWRRAGSQGDSAPDTGEILMRDDGIAPDQRKGDGIYTAEIFPQQPGSYEFSVEATYRQEGVDLVRTASLSGEETAAPAPELQLISDYPEDTNGDGLYDQLILEVRTTVPEEGTYRLSGLLADADGVPLQELYAPPQDACAPNARVTFRLAFSGEALFERGHDGSFLLEKCGLQRIQDNRSIPLWEESVNLPTCAYAHSQFQHAVLQMTGGIQAEPREEGEDHLFQKLYTEIECIVPPEITGYLQWSAYVKDAGGQQIAFAKNSGHLSPGEDGTLWLPLEFQGKDLSSLSGEREVHIGNLVLWDNLKNWTFSGDSQPFSLKPDNFQGWQADILDVTEDTALHFGQWSLNASTGAMEVPVTLTNIQGKGGQPLEKAFWFVLPSGKETKLQVVSGTLADGREYTDVTREIENALPGVGNGDLKLDPGESVDFLLRIYSRKRIIPHGSFYAVWADPPPADSREPAKVGDREMLLQAARWRKGLLDATKYQQILQNWQRGNSL